MKKLSKVLNESIWGKVLDRGAGETVRKEDKITTNKELKNKIQKLYKEQGEGKTLDVSSLIDIINCDDFSGIFEGYKKVKQIIGLEKWDVSHVKYMRSMFYNCYNFNSDLSKWDVSNVKDMRFMFQNCKKFNSDLSKWDVSNVEDMSFMFVNCGNFNYDLSNWDVSKVTDMKFMFQNCEKFNSDLSKWDVSKVINMSYMFLYCINFNSDLSKWNVSKVTDMKYMFDDCKSLKKIPSWYMKRQSKITESIWGKSLIGEQVIL